MKSSSGFADVRERVHATVIELRLLHPVERSAVTVAAYSMHSPRKNDTLLNFVLSILSFTINFVLFYLCLQR